MALRDIASSSDLLRADARAHDQGRNTAPADEALPLGEGCADDGGRGRLLPEHFLIVGILLVTAINAVLHDTPAQSVPHRSHGILARLTNEPGFNASPVARAHAKNRGSGNLAPLH